MRLQYSLRQYFAIVALAILCFYAGWVAKGVLEPRVYVSTNEALPTIGRDVPGHRVVTIAMPKASSFKPGDSVGFLYDSVDNPGGTSSIGEFTVWAADSTSISLLASDAGIAELLLGLPQKPNCRLVKSD